MTEQSLFKIFFNKLTEDLDESHHLTFNSIQSYNLTFSQFPSFLRKFNEQSRKKITRNIQKIHQVIPYGSSSNNEIKQNFVILFSKKNEEKHEKMGYFLGKDKMGVIHILGFWPHLRKNEIMERPSIISQELSDLIENPTKYEDVILVTE